MKYWIRETDPETLTLRTRLDAFYSSSNNNYQAFESTSKQYDYWNKVIERVNELLSRGDLRECRVLEFGAGRSGFFEALGTLRHDVHYVVQDVTERNRDHLDQVADRVFIGDISAVNDEPFDIIFSTFVYEHVTNPKATLEILLQMLAPGGSLFIFCPRYDWPGYVPPALRHLARWRGLWLSILLQLTKLPNSFRFVHGQGMFWIVNEPAVFHTSTWFRDSDAVHLVSRGDLRAYLKRRNLKIEDCWPDKGSTKANVLERLLKLCVEIRKPMNAV